MNDYDKLRKSVEKQVARMKQAEEERPTLLAQSVYMGTIALLFLAPVVGGAYLGNWLDERAAGYSVHWTVGLIVLGLIVGAVNVFLYIREH